MDNYILLGREIVRARSYQEWTEWFINARRDVHKDTIGESLVSTVFLGVDHSFDKERPILFETMVFGGSLDGYQKRASTWEEAEETHRKACALVRATPA